MVVAVCGVRVVDTATPTGIGTEAGSMASGMGTAAAMGPAGEMIDAACAGAAVSGATPTASATGASEGIEGMIAVAERCC